MVCGEDLDNFFGVNFWDRSKGDTPTFPAMMQHNATEKL